MMVAENFDIGNDLQGSCGAQGTMGTQSSQDLQSMQEVNLRAHLQLNTPFDALSAECVADVVEEAIAVAATRLRPDVRLAIENALASETNARARQVLQMMVENDNIAKRDGVPVCQDTGSVWVCLEVGTDAGNMPAGAGVGALNIPSNIFSQVDAAVARAYSTKALRMSMLKDALVDRTNTQNNTPAFTEIKFCEGNDITLHVMLKGGGSDNASRLVMLAPGDGALGVKREVLKCVREKGASACPPLVVGVGVGATFDKVASLAKHALLRDMGKRAADPRVAQIELELMEEINNTGIGPAGLGGNTTALDVHIETAPCHIAALPVAINMGCVAMRSISVKYCGDVEGAKRAGCSVDVERTKVAFDTRDIAGFGGEHN